MEVFFPDPALDFCKTQKRSNKTYAVLGPLFPGSCFLLDPIFFKSCRKKQMKPEGKMLVWTFGANRNLEHFFRPTLHPQNKYLLLKNRQKKHVIKQKYVKKIVIFYNIFFPLKICLLFFVFQFFFHFCFGCDRKTTQLEKIRRISFLFRFFLLLLIFLFFFCYFNFFYFTYCFSYFFVLFFCLFSLKPIFLDVNLSSTLHSSL